MTVIQRGCIHDVREACNQCLKAQHTLIEYQLYQQRQRSGGCENCAAMTKRAEEAEAKVENLRASHEFPRPQDVAQIDALRAALVVCKSAVEVAYSENAVADESILTDALAQARAALEGK